MADTGTYGTPNPQQGSGAQYPNAQNTGQNNVRPVPNAVPGQGVPQIPNAQPSTNAQNPYVQQVSASVQAPYGQASFRQSQPQTPYNQAQYQAPRAQQAQYAQPAPVRTPAPAQDPRDSVRVAKEKKPLGIAGTVLLSFFTALLGAGLLYCALWLTGQLNYPSPLPMFSQGDLVEVTGTIEDPVEEDASRRNITINVASGDSGVAQAVAAKALPSVVSFYVIGSEGEGVGSGVILDTEGNILTNYHVIEGGETITVTIEGNVYDAVIVGTDPSSDLAVCRAELNGATVVPIEIGDSSSLVVGDWVMTIGSPYGLDQSVSSGIVSSLYRSTMMRSSSGNALYTNLIQTDAAINPGNSGGALVDNQGRLVGINSLAASASGGNAGVGFAIPVNYAINVANKLIAGEPVEHAFMGVSVHTVTARNVSEDNLSVNQGAYVGDVTEGGPAAAAGIQTGDVIIRVGRDKIASADALILAVRSHEVGETVEVLVVRGDEQLTLQVTFGSDVVPQSGTEADQSQDDRGNVGE